MPEWQREASQPAQHDSARELVQQGQQLIEQGLKFLNRGGLAAASGCPRCGHAIYRRLAGPAVDVRAVRRAGEDTDDDEPKAQG